MISTKGEERNCLIQTTVAEGLSKVEVVVRWYKYGFVRGLSTGMA